MMVDENVAAQLEKEEEKIYKRGFDLLKKYYKNLD